MQRPVLNARTILRHLLEDEVPPTGPVPGAADSVPTDALDDPELELLARDPKSALSKYWPDDRQIHVIDTGSVPYNHFDALMSRLQGARNQRRKVDQNTYLYYDSPSRTINVRLHGTDVIVVDPDGKTFADTNGWETNTTKDRINQFLPFGWRLYQYAHQWWWFNPNQRDWGGAMIPFADNDFIDPAGWLHAKQPARSEKEVETELRQARRMRREAGRR